jgi:hypothetical protein
MSSSERISADLLISARTLEPSWWANSTTMFANAWTTETGDSMLGARWKISSNFSDKTSSEARPTISEKGRICEQHGAVLGDREHGDRDPLQHNHRGQLLENSHR